MKLRPTQFGVRENTASPRQHAPRLAPEHCSNTICIEEENLERVPSSSQNGPPVPGFNSPLHDASQRAATGEGERRDVAEASAVTLARTPTQNSEQSFEPLMGSLEAAKLLGNIHVKTIQRYARRGSLPGYQIGGHWYFRASELDDWLRSRINSNCQPADRVDLT
jgi:excisionase family DNA binding protein